MKRANVLIFLVLAFMLAFSPAAFGAEGASVPSEPSGAQIVNLAVPEVINDWKAKSGQEWLTRTDFQLYFLEDFKPEYTIETIQPFRKGLDSASFWQGRISYRSEQGTTGNIGIGYRKLSADKQSLWGVNSFYDQAFKYDHQRWGLGVEYFWGDKEFRANTYWGLSGDKEIARDYRYITYERVVDGFDYEIGTALPKAPWLKLFAKGYHWDYKYDSDINGYKLRASMQLTPRFNLELGYYHDNKDSQRYVNFTYNLLDNATTPSLYDSKIKYDQFRANLQPKLLQKVVREMDIRVERFTKIIPADVTVTVLERDGEITRPLPGAVVVVNPGVAAPSIEGNIYTFNGINPGRYTFTASKEGYEFIVDESSKEMDVAGKMALTLVLKKVQPTTTTTVKVKVFEKDGDALNPLSGATVTAPPLDAVNSDVNGVYTFNNAEVGKEYTFTASKTGYQPYNGQDSIKTTVKANDVVTPLILIKTTQPPTTTTVKAEVFEKDGDALNPLSGATVTAPPLEAVNSDVNGVYTFNNAEVGKEYTFTASKTGYQPYNGQDSIKTTVKANDVITPLILIKQPTAKTTVKVEVFEEVNGENVPLSGASVSAPDLGSPTEVSVGVYQFTNAEVGKSYTFTATKTGYVPAFTNSNIKTQTIVVNDTVTPLILKQIDAGKRIVQIRYNLLGSFNKNDITAQSVTVREGSATGPVVATITKDNSGDLPKVALAKGKTYYFEANLTYYENSTHHGQATGTASKYIDLENSAVFVDIPISDLPV